MIKLKPVILRQYKDTDAVHEFSVETESGSVFNYADHTIICEGRISPLSESPTLTFPFETFIDDSIVYGRVKFPSTAVTSNIRDYKIYFKVLATNIVTGKVIVISLGEIWLI